MRCSVCLLLLVACSDPGTGKQTVMVVDNETPPSRLRSVETHQTVSGIAGSEVSVSETGEKPEGLPHRELAPPDLRTLDRTAVKERVRSYEDYLLQPLDQATVAPPKEMGRERDRLPPDARTRGTNLPRNRRTGAPSPKQGSVKPEVWSGGSAPIRVESQTGELSGLLPPGTLFRARLLGDLWVSQYGPLVLAALETEEGDVIGTAIGQASLHPHLRNRVFVRFDRVVVDGRVIAGQLVALDLDRAEGLIGKSSRRPVTAILAGAANALLGALSLEVGVGNGFAEVFRVQLADRLLAEAQKHVDDIDLQRVVFVDRGKSFYMLARNDLRARPGEYATQNLPGVDLLETTFANRVRPREEARHQDLMRAYEKLNRSLTALGGIPDRP